MDKMETLEACKARYPIDSTIEIRGRTIQVTGYHFDGQYWWPVNVVEGFGIYKEEKENGL